MERTLEMRTRRRTQESHEHPRVSRRYRPPIETESNRVLRQLQELLCDQEPTHKQRPILGTACSPQRNRGKERTHHRDH